MVVSDAIKDIKKHIRVGKFLPGKHIGTITGFVSRNGVPFGCGKTANMVRQALNLATRYNNLLVKGTGQIVKVNIISNLDIKCDCNFIKVADISEVVNALDLSKALTDEKYYIFNIIVFDEIGVEFNSRKFSTNFSTEFLSRLVTCRHYNACFFWTAQTWNLVDKTFRDLTTTVYSCNHHWRFFITRQYRPLDLDNLVNEKYIKPIHFKFCYMKDKHFDCYDSTCTYEAMTRKGLEGGYLTREELLDKFDSDNRVYLPNLKRKYKKRK